MAWPSGRYKTAVLREKWVPADMNGIQDQLVRPAGISNEDLAPTTVQAAVGLSGNGISRRGASYSPGPVNITGIEYATLPGLSESITVNLPTNGLIHVLYFVRIASTGTDSSAVYIRLYLDGIAVQALDGIPLTSFSTFPPAFGTFSSCDRGLLPQNGSGHSGPIRSTGQLICSHNRTQFPPDDSVASIYASAGTHTLDVRWRRGFIVNTVFTVTDSYLWVWTSAF